MHERTRRLFDQVAEMDPTLRVRRRDLGRLDAKRLRTAPYSRRLLFTRMARGETSVLRGCPVPVATANGPDLRAAVAAAIRTGFPASARARVQLGPARSRGTLPVPEVMRRWEDGRSLLGVTDLHFRGTRFDRRVDTTELTDFNLLCGRSDPVAALEMMTLVVSSAGNVTDSHTDDSDGSNHCFTGRKLWLAWDRVDGQRLGLEDVTHDDVFGIAAFDMAAFLRVKGARWFIVSPGTTLFLPGALAHKVVTIDRYLGLGSFHVALPSYFATLARWLLDDPRDVKPAMADEVTEAVIRKVRALRRGPPATGDRWGLPHMPQGLAAWKRRETPAGRRRLLAHPLFAAVVDEVEGGRLRATA
jgi:hypothetical protein